MNIKKRGSLIFSFLFIVSLFLILANVSFVISQDVDIPESIPGGKTIGKFGEIDTSTGLPKTLSKFKQQADAFRTMEQNRSFLWKSLFGIAATNPFVGPVLFYTHKGFSFFNPLWLYSFGMEFDWNLAFFAHILIWGILVFFIYDTGKYIFDKKLIAFIAGAVIASIIGGTGVITMAVEQLSKAVTNIWIAFIALFLAILIVVIYDVILKNLKKESDEEDVEEAKEEIEVAGEVAKKGLEEFSEGGGI